MLKYFFLDFFCNFKASEMTNLFKLFFQVQNLLQQMASRPVKITDSMLYQLGLVN
ncbi:hypothetical protein ACSBR2_011133 [Camellia fascicularis]